MPLLALAQVRELSKDDLLLSGWLDDVFSSDDEIERANYCNAAKLRAKELGCAQEFAILLAAYKKEVAALKKQNARIRNENVISFPFETDGYGRPIPTIANFLLVFRNDPEFASLRFNELSRAPERTVRGVLKRWTDADDAKAREYIERVYKFHSAQKCDDAMRILFSERSYNPVVELIDSLEWDGVPRIENLLHEWMMCDDTPYTREVSRLIFAGGIHRIYNPGCKFDDTPVLIGTKQGEGKSTFVRWLAMRDEFFTEVTEIEGQKGMEDIEGAWICEIGELLALTRARDVEAVKSFMTRQIDHYRKPYDKRPGNYPRMCIFIGTTNREQFLTDKTGNRRFYPVRVRQRGYELFDRKEEVRAYIRQCWAEAKYLYDAGELPPYARRELIGEIRSAQSEAVEDDYRVGQIEEYLRDHQRVCVLELWENALGNRFQKPTPADSRAIGLIMAGMSEWKRMARPVSTADYGKQRCWERISGTDLSEYL